MKDVALQFSGFNIRMQGYALGSKGIALDARVDPWTQTLVGYKGIPLDPSGEPLDPRVLPLDPRVKPLDPLG